MGKCERFSAIKIALVYTAVVVGAGFASGQEMMRFFVRYGDAGLLGLIISGAMLGLSGWAVLDICAREELKDYGAFMARVLGEKFGKIMDFVVAVFIMVLFCAMLSGVGSLTTEGFNLPFSFGVFGLSAFCAVVFIFGLEGVVVINAFLAPFLIAGALALGIFGIIDAAPAFADSNAPLVKVWSSWPSGALIYSSYNVITAVTILVGMASAAPKAQARKTAKRAGLLGGACVTVLGVCFFIPLYAKEGGLLSAQLPMLTLTRSYGIPALSYIYIFVLLAAVATTAVSNGFAVINWMERNLKCNRYVAIAFVCVGGAIIAHVGLDALVGGAYPVFGFLGFFEMAAIIIYFLVHNASGKTALDKRA